jgi:ribosomal-protein-alanine N-acetyltransferase
MNEDLELHTERLTLKVLGPSYASQVLAYLVRNRAFFKEWNPATGEEYFSLAHQEQRLRNELALMRDGWMLRLHLFKRDDTTYRTVIGDLALNNIIYGAFLSCHLGYKVAEQQLNQGFMTEAVRAAIGYAFGELRLHRIEANIMPRNARSRRVVEKLEFVEEGLARKYLKINGVWEDHIHYVLLNDAV